MAVLAQRTRIDIGGGGRVAYSAFKEVKVGVKCGNILLKFLLYA